MATVRVDISGALAGLQNIRTNQLPYAISRALNDCADEAVNDLAVRAMQTYNFRGNAAWMKRKWWRSRWSNKRDLRAYVDGLMDYLFLHEFSGVRLPHRGPHLAVPLGTLRYQRIPPQYRPRFLLGQDLQGVLIAASIKGKKSRLNRMTAFNQGFLLQLGTATFIAMRTSADVGMVATSQRLKGMRLLYLLVPSVKVKATLGMAETVRNSVQRTFYEAFRRRYREAVATAR